MLLSTAQSKKLFVLMRGNGIMILEDPKEAGYLNPPETVLRVFMSARELRQYMAMKADDANELRVGKTDLLTIWNLLGHINGLSIQQFKAPVRVELSSIKEDGTVADITTLHSFYRPRC
jgi:hypothetical protein